MNLRYLLLLVGAATPVISQEPKQVFAHFIVGNAAHMTAEEWKADITLAREAHIDGFALNIAPQDSYTDDVLSIAYEVAAEVGDFTMFLSFDYLSGGPWPIDRVIETINSYRDSPAQTIYQGKPLVSTFEGAGNTDDWPTIKADADCFLVPSWTSMGPEGFKNVLDIVDGAFSWDAWAEGAQLKTLDSDRHWMNAIGDKVYMMPIAPWFYTDLPQWEKNWLWRGDDLWHERWQQAIELQPPMIEIITWNDFGEASYIGPIRETGIPDGAQDYVLGNPHDAWRALLPQYIDSYKSGNKTLRDVVMPQTKNGVVCDDCGDEPRIASASNPEDLGDQDVITFWYRRTPSYAGQTGGTTGNNPAQGQQALPPGEVSEDKIFLSVLVAAPSDINVAIGDSEPTTRRAKTPGVSHFNVPFDQRCGPVKITVLRDGNEVVSTDGPAITEETPNGKSLLQTVTLADITHDSPESCPRLDSDNSDTLTLADGRKLGYAQFGLQTGRAIFYQHGSPGSRLEGVLFHELGLELGARIIVTDRPGGGWSSPHPGRTLLDHPKDLEQLAQHLKLDEYGVVGISGGGPYALACAMALPADKLKSVSIVCGLGPPDIGMSGAGLLHRFAFTIGYRICPHPVFMRWFFESRPGGRLDMTDEQRLEDLLRDVEKSKVKIHEKDLEMFRDEDFLRVTLRTSRECFAHGYDGVLQDGKLLSTDHGFRVEDIRSDLPVQLWYGKYDTFVPLNHGKQIAARLGGGDRVSLRIEDETHGSITLNRRREILEALLENM